MKINICKIYEENILNKYDETNREDFLKKFTVKEREMWTFTAELIKDNFPVKEYDSSDISDYLREYHSIYMCDSTTKFTIDEWFDYLGKLN